VRESNDETAFAATGELSALDRESGEPLAAVSGTIVRNNSQPPSAGSHWRVALVVGTGLGAALSALSYSQRSVNLVREASVTSAERPAAHELSAPAATLAPPAAQPTGTEAVSEEAAESNVAAQPTAAEAMSEEAAESNVAAQPTAAAITPGTAAEPDVATQPSAAEAPGQTAPSSLAVQNAARSPAPNQPSARATLATRKPDKVSGPAPANLAERAVKTEDTPAPAAAPDSEEARLAAAAVRTGSDIPLDSVIDDAFTNAQARAEQRRAALAAAAAVPWVPARDDVIHAMRELLPALRECAQGQTGLATADVMVSNDGHVQMVGLTGHAFGGTPSGRCMEGVLLRAHFPRFRQASFRMQFPFLLE
jgi:hypothetical protein